MSRHRVRIPPPTPSRDAVAIEARALEVDRGPRRVLRGMDLVVRIGELVVVAGPNGAGKSTLIGALVGDLPLTGGAVLLDGADLSSWTPVERAMRRAVLPQDNAVAFPFTVLDVVTMGRAPWAGTDRQDQDDDVVARALADVEMEAFATRRVPQLSGGERARVALARTLAQRSPLLLLDEPIAALDLHHQELVLDRTRRHVDAGGAAIAVLHDLTQAAAHADRIVLIDDGRVVVDGSPTAVLDPALLSDVYRFPIDVVAHPRTGRPVVTPAPDRHAMPAGDRSPLTPSSRLTRTPTRSNE